MNIVAQLLRDFYFTFQNERELQDLVAEVLENHFPKQVVREFRLSGTDRIDFMVSGKTGVEVKIGSSHNSVLRQIHRYAQSDKLSEIVLFTNRSKHVSMPDCINGKPIHVVFTGGYV